VVVTERTFSERILHFLDGKWLEKHAKKPREKVSRGKSPADGAFHHELDANHRRFWGVAYDDLFELLKTTFKRRGFRDE
jgi:hypothetical protein